MTAWALVLTFFWITPAQSPQQLSYIQGIVTRSDGTTPITGARVLLRKDQSVRSESDYGTITSADGHFTFKDVAAGRYRLQVKQTGYLDAEYGQKRANRPGSVLDLSQPLTLTDIRIQMTAGAVISGRVYDQDGQPLDNVQIQLIQRRYQPDGRVIPLMVTTTTTNDLGEYRVYWIAPGTYYMVGTNFSRNPQAETALNEQFEGVESIFVPTFYPNSLDETRAVPITVESGGEVRGVDITMTRLRTVHVRGQVIDGATGQIVPGSRVSIQPKYSGWAHVSSTSSTLVGINGDFDVRRVPPGTNTVSVMMTMPGGRQASSYSDIQVGDRDITDLRLVLQPPPSISGRLVFENAEPRSGALSFFDINGPASFGAAVLPNGSFTLFAVPPGVYRLSLNGFPENLFVRSAYSGSRDVLRDGIDTTSGSSENVEVHVALTAGVVQGSVSDDRGNPDFGVQVAVIPDIDRETRPELFRASTTDQLGRFSVKGVVPGNYKVFAWMDIEPGIYHDPNFLAPFEAAGTPVRVEDSGTVTVSLKVIP